MKAYKQKPWLVNDVTAQARKIARDQSATHHIKIGAWVNHLILEHGNNGGVTNSVLPVTPHIHLEKSPIRISWWKKMFS